MNPAESPPRSSLAISKNPFALAFASAIAFWLAFPPADRGFLGWFALAPFFSLVRCDQKPWKVYLASWFGGMIFGVLSVSWVACVDVIGMLLLAFYMSLWWPLFLLPARLGVRRLGLPLMLVAPVVWVGLEYLRSLLVSGFPWYYLAHSQHAYLPMIQVCDLFGAWGLSFLMAMVNVLGAELGPRFRREVGITTWTRTQVIETSVIVALVLASLAYGAIRLSTSKFRPGPRVALLQTDISQGLKNAGLDLAQILAKIDALVIRAAESTPRPDLLVWPETSYPPGFVKIDPKLSAAEFARLAKIDYPDWTPNDWRSRQRHASVELHGLTDSIRIPMVIGLASYDFGQSEFLKYNSAVLMAPGKAEISRYNKRALVPVGEYFPFLEVMPWLLWLTPYTDGYVPTLSPGQSAEILESQGVRYAPIICFEDTIPWISREAANASNKSGRADVLLNLTNDGWFMGSAEQPTHLAISVFRAVECRLPLARAVNTGISALIDGNGRIRQSLRAGQEGVLIVEIPLDGRFSFYRWFGDSFAILCLTLTVVLFPACAYHSRQTAPLAQGASVG